MLLQLRGVIMFGSDGVMQGDWGTKVRVGTALSLLIGGKVCRAQFQALRDRLMLTAFADLERGSAFLLQEHCRFNEYRFRGSRRHGLYGGRHNDPSM